MAISVGDAVLKLGVDTKALDKGMQGLKGKMKQHTKAIGLAVTAMGGAILAVGVLSIKTYAEMGDEVAKMAIRTGFSTEALSELRHAAEISGATLGTLEKGVKKMAVSISDARDGLMTYTREFDKIGISMEDLQDLNPEEQFFLIAEAIASLEDPTQRAASAQKILGRAGTELLPLFAAGKEGMAELRQEAHELGIVFDQEAANKAAEMTDAMHRLNESTSGLKMEIADKLIPVLMPLIEKITSIVKGISAWMAEHPGLTKIIVIGTAAFGVLLIVLGSLLMLMPGITAAVAAFGITLSAAIWPITLIVAAIVGLIAIGILLWKNWDKVGRFFENLWLNMKIWAGTAIKFMVNTVLRPFLVYIDKFLGTIVRAIAKVVGIFNTDWAASIEKVADSMSNLDDTITEWADNLIDSSERGKQALREVGQTAYRTFEEIDAALEGNAEVVEQTVDTYEVLADAMDEVAAASDEMTASIEGTAVSLGTATYELDGYTYRMSLYTQAEIDAAIAAGYKVEEIERQTVAMGEDAEATDRAREALEGFTESQVTEEERARRKREIQRGEEREFDEEEYQRFVKWYEENVGILEGEALRGLFRFWDPELQRMMTSEELMAQALEEIAADLKAAGVRHVGGGVFEPIAGISGVIEPLQRGGIVMRPMLASIAERRPEAVIPLDRFEGMMGGKRVSIYVELDGRIIAEAVEVRLTNDIRLRTGVKI